MKIFTSTLNQISNNEALRLDFGMRYIDDILDFNPFSLKKNYIILKDVLIEIKSKKVKKGNLTDVESLIDLDNIVKRFNLLQNIEKVSSIESDKTVLEKGDIIIAKMTPRLGTMFLNDKHNKYLGSTELVEYSIKNYDNVLLYYILTANKFLEALSYMESGKNQRRVKPSDLLKLKIPVYNKDDDDYVKEKQKDIYNLVSRKNNMQDIIDSSFKNELGINILAGNKHIKTSMVNVGKDGFCRFSFHNQNFYNTIEYNKMDTDEWVSISSKFLVKGGKRIPKGMSFSTDPTDFYYLRPTEVSIMGLNKEEFPYISKEVHNILKNYSINNDEFCISNVGTLGKVGLVNLNELGIKNGNLILSENFVKLTPLKTLNLKFYYYYFNSYLFQKQIDREYTITSIMKLGLDKIKNILIPNFSAEKEKNIINRIENSLEEQKQIIRKINSLREEIDVYFTNQTNK